MHEARYLTNATHAYMVSAYMYVQFLSSYILMPRPGIMEAK